MFDTTRVGARNYLVEGVSSSGKTTVATELERRGHHVWDVDRVRELVADRSAPATFFCGGSRNHATFIDLFDEVFVLEVDTATLTGATPRSQAWVLANLVTHNGPPHTSRTAASARAASSVTPMLGIVNMGSFMACCASSEGTPPDS